MAITKIGLTGGIGSGKSIVCELIKALGYPVFNSDHEAKLLMTENASVRANIKDVFGEEAYSNNQLNREFLASKIFYDESLKAALNQIVHPAVRSTFEEWASLQNKKLVFNEAAILFETGAYKSFDFTVLVTAPKDIRIARVTHRDNSTEEEVQQRMKNQWDDDVKKELATFIINNDNKTLVMPQVLKVLSHLEQLI
ncbi:dephospho-CoA kinase [Brumimicrobium oceani]|uniref:Dephospho-CoA kinase n=1 Tax=Brumimicrobium oceani TaxID=2100725 RepID=A0A2U2X1B9_9FLAO|nr:dephospho-CoA kinase [Brumimicrobium oceani]PWH81560.1 dephospho-CoA kinase [Brumimicrobium oceani]